MNVIDEIAQEAERDRLRVEQLEAILRECGATIEEIRREERTGPAEAKKEEFRRRPDWKVRR